MMVLLGLLVIFAGFALSLASLGMASTVGGRMGMVLAGIVLSLVGIVGVLNPAYIKNAIWKR